MFLNTNRSRRGTCEVVAGRGPLIKNDVRGRSRMENRKRLGIDVWNILTVQRFEPRNELKTKS